MGRQHEEARTVEASSFQRETRVTLGYKTLGG